MALEQQVNIPKGGPVLDPDLPQRRLALVAEAAERLLAADDPARMVDELFALIQTELRLDVFFNYRLEENRLLLEAHGGLTPEEAVAGAELELGQAVCGCAARDRQRFHVTGVQKSDDPLVAFVRQVGLDAYACTPLLHGDTLIGTLGFGRRWADRFTDDELRFLHTLCHFVELAKYRFMVEQKLRTGFEQRNRLLSELNHRVRNALQLAVSVVRLEAASARGEAFLNALNRAVERIEVIASAHRPIYASEDFSIVNIFDLLGAVGEAATDQKLTVTGARDVNLPIEQGVALALLVHTALAESSAANEPATVEVVRGHARRGRRLS
ncbi:histidine kinase dimerization/phosphoacceptor domain -containing protein [Sphingomonas sp. IW22]|uniref:histidine kinase dimerization/phosphoacceptor domain -containing protein n=1 Tax=Sphingomonas sp. IW22 TaxID=3242489 RepID=UPI003522AB67